MAASASFGPLAAYASFGELLKYLRRRARLSQRELSIAVGYSESQISRLEHNLSAPDPATLAALFVPALLLQDEPETVARLLELAAAVRAAPAAEANPAPNRASFSTVTTNLPLQWTSFIGRERELAEVERRLAQAPLVTLAGAGGSGKTRLALQAAADLAARFPDGAWLVELAPLADPALVLPTTAALFGLQAIPGRPLDQALADALKPQSLLLILDNCEHVIQACAELADALLRACPHLRLLATSREPLNVTGEVTVSVPPLSLPEAPLAETPAAVLDSDAGRLFIDRAQAVKLDFMLTEANAPLVAQICRRLDGLPLALELAAARLRALSLEQIAARLDDRFRLLTGGSRIALARHQTLAALIDWSYDLLSEAERIVLRRLAVFRGGWTLEAAEAVCAGEGLTAAEVLNTLSQLVDKSLVIVEERPGGTRYHFLETIREYALRRLNEAGEAEIVRGRHAGFFLKLLEISQPDLVHIQRLWHTWLQSLTAEHDNLRSCLEWALASDPELGIQLTGMLGNFWFNGGYPSEGLGYLRRAPQLITAVTPQRIRTLLMKATAGLAMQQGDYAGAASAFRDLAENCRERGDQLMLAAALIALGRMQALCSGPQLAARAYQQNGFAILRAYGDKEYLAIKLPERGWFALAEGDEAAARALNEESVALFRELEDRHDITTPLGYLGYLALRQGGYLEARRLFTESMDAARGWHGWGIAWRLEGFAALAVKDEGNPDRAARLYGAAQAMLDSIGAVLDPIDRLGYEGYVAEARAQLGEAAFQAAWAAGRKLSREAAIAYALGEAPAGA